MNILLTILLALWTLKQATGACNLCFDGETITKPDYVLDLTDPVSIKTCQDLVNLLVFIPENDQLCSSARAVSTLCGCPNVLPNACSICGGNMTRPLQNLDGLVDLGDVDFFGLSPTCALVESGINRLNEGEGECSSLPIDELQMNCGCLSTDDNKEDENACTLCPGGEIVSGNAGRVVTLNSNENRVSCSEAQQMVTGEQRGSVLCNDIQRGSTSCGCPVPENACQLCPGGEVLQNNWVDTIFGIRQTCGSFNSQMHRYDIDSAECQSLDESYREACGCQTEREFVQCNLCPGGESVAYPDKVIVGMEGFGFDYLEPTCGTYDLAVRLTDENDSACISARALAKICGCNVPETSCSICEAGISMSNPLEELQWAFGSITETLPQFSETIDFNDRKFRCEFADSFFSSVYEQSDNFCYFNQLIRGTACGCGGSNNTKVIALVWTQRCSGVLSLLGSLTIIVFVLTKKTKNRWNTYNQVVLSISAFDMLSSLAYIFGTALTPTSLGLYGSIGNEGTCTFQGWLFQMGITSVYYNVVLCFYFIFVVKYDWNERKFKKVRKWVHLGVLLVGISMSVAVIPFVTADWRWCYLNKPPIYESWLPGVFFFILPIGICMLAMTVLMAFFVKYVHEVESKSKARRLVGSRPNRQSLANRTFWQSVYFLAVFYIVWPIQFVAFVIPLVESNYWVYLLAALVGPLQGFLNAMVVFFRDRKAVRELILRMLGISYIKEKWSSAFAVFGRRNSSTYTSQQSSSEGVAQVAVEEEQPKSPYLVESKKQENSNSHHGADSNLSDRQVDQLLPVTTSTQRKSEDLLAASYRDGDIDASIGVDAIFDTVDDHERQAARRRSSLFESDAIIEYAMNAGLLNDDEYLQYEASICALNSN